MEIISKAKSAISTVKEYWSVPPSGKNIPYKEIASLSGAGFGFYWTTLLASQIGLSASNFLVGASIGLRPMDLQIMLTIANLIGIPIGIFRSWYYDNHHIPGGKFLPFIQMSVVPMVLVSTIFVWLPYESFSYILKAIVVEIMYLLLNVFLCLSYSKLEYVLSLFLSINLSDNNINTVEIITDCVDIKRSNKNI